LGLTDECHGWITDGHKLSLSQLTNLAGVHEQHGHSAVHVDQD